MVGKRKLIGNVNNVAFSTILHDGIKVLRRRLSGSSLIERIYLICEEAKGHACRYFKTIEEGINPALYTWVIIECIAVEVIEL